MKGIYLTEEGKREIESKISELEYIFLQNGERFDTRDSGKYNIYKEILSSAIMFPVEESWKSTVEEYFPLLDTTNDRTGEVEEENLQLLGHRRSFIVGAKWQAERMYSEQDMKLAWEDGRDCTSVVGNFPFIKTMFTHRSFTEWFEKHKKK
jgi:hypothetical protein